MRAISLFILLSLTFFAVSAQSFTQNTSLIPATYNSGGCTGVTDMDNDGLDDIVILDNSRDLSIAYQQVDGSFLISYFGLVSGQSQWGMCIGDVDNDGHKDVMCGGSYDDVHILNIDGPGIYTQTNYAWADIFMQGSNLVDINNDGLLDGFACHDDGHNVILLNEGNGAFSNGTYLIDMVFYPENGSNDNSGNYGSVWTDFDRDGDTDLFIAKCRQFVSDPFDPRRTNVLVINNGDGTYDHTNPATGFSFAQERGLVNLEQSWTSDFADIDNDGDFDCFLTTHSNTLEIYENDGNGYFTDRTQGSGLQYSGFFLQGKLHDLDNDGLVDLIHAGGSHDYYRNNGNFTFTRVQNTFVNNDIMHSFAIGDLNHDGYLDVYASYGDGYVDADNAHPDRIFINNGGTNNWISFDLEGIISNKEATGAIVEITGSFGTQVREIRSGESYGITNTATCHFGIGTATTVDEVHIEWPSGVETTLINPSINTRHQLIESPCYLASPVISAVGPTQFCEGGSVVLQATDANLNYTWNTGQTSNSITVTEPGNYFATATSTEGCLSITNAIPVSFSQTPSAEILADETIESCSTETTVLTASSGTSYAWSNGATTPSINVTASGIYTVQVTSVCGTATSSPVQVDIIAVPASPNIANASVPVNTSATLVSPGNENTNWYAGANDTEPIFTGSTFQTPTLVESSSYWVETFNTGAQASFVGGSNNWLLNGQGQYQPNSTYYMLFDAHHDAIIRTVKVYASGAADRTIALVDPAGNTLAQATVAIPNGESVVELNFFVPQGTGYGLRCVGNNPLLWRDKDLTTPFTYPYEIGDLITITNTNISGADTDNYYYYFYEWNVEKPVTYCYSNREEVIVTVENVQILEGCTDPTACNFDPAATTENGLCAYPGCTNPLACNYAPTAGCDDGSCIIESNGTPIIWQDDFSQPSNWIIAHDGTFNSDFQIGIGLESTGQYGTPAIQSTTASNGYALYNSDSYNNSAGVAYEQAHITTASPIDLSGYPNVTLEFQTQYRRWNDEQTWLIVSTDGTFPVLDDPTTDISGMPGVFRVWENGELTQSVSPGNPTTRQFNISEIAGGASQVWVRFQFTGIWGYAWYIDDLSISEQLPYDANLESSIFTYSATNVENGRIPVGQVPETFYAKGTVTNEGVNMLSALEVYVNITEVNTGDIYYNAMVAQYSALNNSANISFNQPISLNQPLPEGLYQTTISVLHSACDGYMSNNFITRNFEVTPLTFSADAIDLHPDGTEILQSIGTNSFIDNADEFGVMTYYEITSGQTAYGIEIGLASSSVAGGEIVVYLNDTLDVFSDVVFNPIAMSDYYTVTEADILAGTVFIPFSSPIFLNPNGYYATAFLFSNGNSNDLRILDDVTTPQPSMTSMIYLPSDGVIYSNGNAFAVRLLFGSMIQIYGCTDASACNYNPDANNEDGSCTFPGCNDVSACNFEATAGCFDGTCVYPGCTNMNACNYDIAAGCDDGSCLIANTPCNDGNSNTYGDLINADCICSGTPFNYGQINTPDAGYCSNETAGTMQSSAPQNISNYTIQWYYVEGTVGCPSGSSTAGWNAIAGANALSYSPETFAGARTFACFISPVASSLPAAWAAGCVTYTFYAFSAQTIIGNPNVTPFSSFTYAVNPIPGNTYTWSVTNGAITTGQGTNTIQVLWGQNGPYQVTLTENNGVCESTSTLLVVNANCSITVNAFASGGNTFCAGAEVSLQTTTTAATPSYQWYFNGQTIPSSNTASLTITQPGSYQVMITQDACTAVSQVINLTTFPAINTPQIEVATTGEGCLTQGATLSLNTAEFASISWNTGATTPTLVATASGIYTATITDANGCSASSLPIELNLALEPSVPICLVTVTESNTNQVVWEPLFSEVTTEYRIYKEGSVAEQYDWIGSVPYGQDGLFTDASSNASVQASRYKLAIVDSCGVESFLTPLHKTIHLTSNVGLNNTVNLIWSHYEGFGFGSYNIYRGDALGNLTLLTAIASNLNSYTDTAPLAGPSYYLVEVEGVSCDPTRDVVFSRSNKIQIDVSGLRYTDEQGIQLYPNPASDLVNVAITSQWMGSTMRVHSMLGKLVSVTALTNALQELNISLWEAGVYVIELEKDGNTINTMLVKQ